MTLYKLFKYKGKAMAKEEGGDQGKNYWTGWLVRDTANLRKKLNIEKRWAIGSLDLPEGRELKEEDNGNRYINSGLQTLKR